MEKHYTVGEFGDLIGKSVNTLQRWDREGILTAYRSPSKRRYYTHTQYLEYIGAKDISNKVNVIYARASKNQQEELENQIKFLSNYCTNNGIPISNIYSDYGSGLDYSRKNWNKLIDDCIDNNVCKIFISHRDRFTRFGFNWISNILQRFGVEIVVIENITTSPDKEIIEDLISIMKSFSNRIPFITKYRTKIEKEEN